MDEDETLTHAKVKFIENFQTGQKSFNATVPITDILQFQKIAPTHSENFDKKKIYTCWYKNSKTKKSYRCGIQIGQLCTATEAAKNIKRPVFAKLYDSVIEKYFNDGYTSDDNDAEEMYNDDSELDSESEQDTEQHEKKKKLKEKIQRKSIERVKDEQNKILLQAKMKAMLAANTLDLKNSSTLQQNPSVDALPMSSPNNTAWNNEEHQKEQSEKSGEIKKQLKEFEDLKNNYKSLQLKYDKLKKLYDQQQERLESVLILNEKLQKLVLLGETKVKETTKEVTTPPIDYPIYESTPVSSRSNKALLSFHSILNSNEKDKNNISMDGIENETDKNVNNNSEKLLDTSNKYIIDSYAENKIEEDCYDDLLHISPKINSGRKRDLQKRKINQNVQSDCSGDEKRAKLDEMENDINAQNKSKKNNRKNHKSVKGSDVDSESETNTTPKSSGKSKHKKKGNDSDISDSDASDNDKKGNSRSKVKSRSKDDKGVFLQMKDSSTSNVEFLKKSFNKETNEWMYYLKHDLSIERDKWRTIMRSSNESRFTKALLRHFYKDTELTKICVIEKGQIKTPRGHNSRKRISSLISDTIETCLRYYLKKKNGHYYDKHPNKLNTELSKKNHYISEEINKVMKEAKAKLKQKSN